MQYAWNMPLPPDRGNHPGRQVQPLNMVRGGGICDPHERGGHIVKGSNQPAICSPTPGPDSRPRWRQAGKISSEHSRHSTVFLQHRKGGQPYGR